MGANFTKYIVISLVIGLVVGFFGGYGYQNLNADAPATTKTASAILVSEPASDTAIVEFESGEGDESGAFGNILMAAIGNAIVESVKAEGNGDLERGLEKITGASAPTSYLPDRFVSSALDSVFPPAQAQKEIIKKAEDLFKGIFKKRDGTPKCDEKTLAEAISYTKQWYDKWAPVDFFKNAPCVRELIIEAPVNNKGEKQNNLKVTVYEKKDGLRTITFFGFELSGIAKVKYYGINENKLGRPCEYDVEAGVSIAKRGAIRVTTGLGVKNPPPSFEISNTPPDGFVKICRADAVFEHAVANAGYKPTKEECCDPKRVDPPTD